jgi:hypothetical protein
MIKGINGSNGVVVSGGNMAHPYTSTNSENPMQGVLRMRGTDIQYMDNTSWMSLPTSYATVELSPEIQSLLDWVRTERNRSLQREQQIQKHPALKNAHDAIKRAEANYDLIEKFVEHDNDNANTTSS